LAACGGKKEETTEATAVVDSTAATMDTAVATMDTTASVAVDSVAK
jgi:hypothetical protein